MSKIQARFIILTAYFSRLGPKINVNSHINTLIMGKAILEGHQKASNFLSLAIFKEDNPDSQFCEKAGCIFRSLELNQLALAFYTLSLFPEKNSTREDPKIYKMMAKTAFAIGITATLGHDILHSLVTLKKCANYLKIADMDYNGSIDMLAAYISYRITDFPGALRYIEQYRQMNSHDPNASHKKIKRYKEQISELSIWLSRMSGPNTKDAVSYLKSILLVLDGKN